MSKNHTGLEMKYFVLSPTKDNEYGKASRDAIRQYAHSIAPTNMTLADDLLEWIEKIEKGMKL